MDPSGLLWFADYLRLQWVLYSFHQRWLVPVVWGGFLPPDVFGRFKVARTCLVATGNRLAQAQGSSPLLCGGEPFYKDEKLLAYWQGAEPPT